jgi:hypothetical protein
MSRMELETLQPTNDVEERLCSATADERVEQREAAAERTYRLFTIERDTLHSYLRVCCVFAYACAYTSDSRVQAGVYECTQDPRLDTGARFSRGGH